MLVKGAQSICNWKIDPQGQEWKHPIILQYMVLNTVLTPLVLMLENPTLADVLVSEVTKSSAAMVLTTVKSLI